MFVDEAAKNKKTLGRSKGWSLMGKRCIQWRCFVCGQRYSILPILTLDGIITYDVIEGSVTATQFIKFLRELVVRALSKLFTLMLIIGILSSHSPTLILDLVAY
jgi:hypothetical protein